MPPTLATPALNVPRPKSGAQSPKNACGGMEAGCNFSSKANRHYPQKPHQVTPETRYASPTHVTFYGYRFYNPNFGRWANRDPLQERGGKNLYAITGNNLINTYDILGLLTDFEAFKQLYNHWEAPNGDMPFLRYGGEWGEFILNHEENGYATVRSRSVQIYRAMAINALYNNLQNTKDFEFTGGKHWILRSTVFFRSWGLVMILNASVHRAYGDYVMSSNKCSITFKNNTQLVRDDVDANPDYPVTDIPISVLNWIGNHEIPVVLVMQLPRYQYFKFHVQTGAPDLTFAKDGAGNVELKTKVWPYDK